MKVTKVTLKRTSDFVAKMRYFLPLSPRQLPCERRRRRSFLHLCVYEAKNRWPFILFLRIIFFSYSPQWPSLCPWCKNSENLCMRSLPLSLFICKQFSQLSLSLSLLPQSPLSLAHSLCTLVFLCVDNLHSSWAGESLSCMKMMSILRKVSSTVAHVTWKTISPAQQAAAAAGRSGSSRLTLTHV